MRRGERADGLRVLRKRVRLLSGFYGAPLGVRSIGGRAFATVAATFTAFDFKLGSRGNATCSSHEAAYWIIANA